MPFTKNPAKPDNRQLFRAFVQRCLDNNLKGDGVVSFSLDNGPMMDLYDEAPSMMSIQNIVTRYADFLDRAQTVMTDMRANVDAVAIDRTEGNDGSIHGLWIYITDDCMMNAKYSVATSEGVVSDLKNELFELSVLVVELAKRLESKFNCRAYRLHYECANVKIASFNEVKNELRYVD